MWSHEQNGCLLCSRSGMSFIWADWAVKWPSNLSEGKRYFYTTTAVLNVVEKIKNLSISSQNWFTRLLDECVISWTHNAFSVDDWVRTSEILVSIWCKTSMDYCKCYKITQITIAKIFGATSLILDLRAFAMSILPFSWDEWVLALYDHLLCLQSMFLPN